jgi:hypothetical protein
MDGGATAFDEVVVEDDDEMGPADVLTMAGSCMSDAGN